MPFVFDTSSLIVISNYYPEHFETFWNLFEEAIKKSEVVSCREVLNELSTRVTPDWYLKWLKKNSKIFQIATSQEAEFVGEIFKVSHFQTLVGEKQRLKGSPVADPFVVAKAKIIKGTVLTQEAKKPNAAKIPNVCEHFSIPWTNVQGFLSAKKWKF